MAHRIAVLGGTFDPPHIGHLVAASEIRFRGAFDEVVLMVANDPWQKRGTREITPAAVRLEMVRAAVADHPGLVAGDLEIGRGGPTYTVDTVEAMLAADPTAEITIVLGDDALAGLPTWHRAADLATLVRVMAVARPGHHSVGAVDGWTIERIEVPAVDISSTQIRSRCAEGRPIDFLVTEPVRSVMTERGLYGVRR